MSDDLSLTEAIAFAYATGYDVGHAHGRRDERAQVEQERRQAAAGRIVTRLADLPEITPDELRRRREGRARTAERIASLTYRGSHPA